MRCWGYLFVVALLGLVAGSGQAHAFPDAWQQCDADSDCVKIYDCMDQAINKTYLNEWQKTQMGACRAALPPNPVSVAMCRNHRCDLVVPPPKN